jgi:hypothetical protein
MKIRTFGELSGEWEQQQAASPAAIKAAKEELELAKRLALLEFAREGQIGQHSLDRLECVREWLFWFS